MPKVLVVDDSKAMRMLLRSFMHECDMATDEAGDGQQALDQVTKEGPFDLALVDWNMPVMSGIEFLREVRARELAPEMKIMMVTTENSMEAMEEAFELGIDDFLMKPVNKDMVIDKLRILGFVD